MHNSSGEYVKLCLTGDSVTYGGAIESQGHVQGHESVPEDNKPEYVWLMFDCWALIRNEGSPADKQGIVAITFMSLY